MPALRAPVVYSVAASTVGAVPGGFYRADATAGPVTVNLPIAAMTQPGYRIFVKKVDASANTVTVAAAAGDSVDGVATNVLSNLNQCHEYHPGTPAGSVYGQGWMSF